MSLGFVVLAKRASFQDASVHEYAVVSSVWSTIEPCENHAGWCEASAERDPERFGQVEYVVAQLVMPESSVSEPDGDCG